MLDKKYLGQLSHQFDLGNSRPTNVFISILSFESLYIEN